MNFSELMIGVAARYEVARQVLGDRFSLETAREIDRWLLNNESILPKYSDVHYISQAIALYEQSNRLAA
jgi:hypothetical protein